MRIAVCITGGERALPIPAADELWDHRPGPAWEARNRVLEETEADVIAFLDHDVAFEAGWLERLRRLWADADPGIAAIGGPIGLSGVPDPGWLGGALALQDLGPERLVLDPAKQTLHGGNLSFRTWQLAAVGGFKPQFDGREQRDWFSEEHEAQRELGRWGWRVAYEPELRTERVADPAARELLSGRWRYGARAGRLGRRGRGGAAKQALTSAAGLAPALARRQSGLALERAARAAENTAAALARRRGEPAAAAPPPTGPGGLILLYHRVTVRDPDPLGLCVTPDHFGEQLDVLRDREVVPLSEMAAAPRPGTVAITFDDGYADNHAEALPRLAAAGLPATLFAATAHIEGGRGFFWDELTQVFLAGRELPDRLELEIGGERRGWDTSGAEERERARYDLHHLLQPRSPELIEDVLARLRDWSGAAPAAADRPASVDELRELAGALEIGAHTRRHVSIRFQPREVQRAEIEGSRDDVAAWTGGAPRAFSYPFGVPGRDFVRRTAAAVADAGFELAVGNHPGLVGPGADRYALPRVVPPDAGGEEFAAWLSAAASGRPASTPAGPSAAAASARRRQGTATSAPP